MRGLTVDPADRHTVLALSVAWIATIAWLGVSGEFSVSDDWAYAHTARVLVEEGRFELLDWTWVPMRTNAALGWLFSQAFGFSLETLRLSSAFMGWLGLLGVFALSRQLGAASGRSALAAVLYGWNPVHLPLSLTFMTDVPFGALVAWALFCFARGLPALAWRWIAAGALLALAASFSRQPGIGLFIAALVAAFADRPSRAAIALFVAAGVAFVVLALAPERERGALALSWFLRSILGEPRPAFWALVRNTPILFFLCGAFSLPFTVGHAIAAPRAAMLAGAGGAALTVALIAKLGLGVPPGIDWWFDLGIGPGSHVEPGAFPSLPRSAAWALAAIAGASGGVMMRAVAGELWNNTRAQDRAATWAVVFFAALYLGLLAIRIPFFDRYTIALMPALLATLAAALPRRATRREFVLGAATALPLLIFTLGATHDWREREKARAVLLDELVAEGISPKRIDGGGAFNATHNYGPVRYPTDPDRAFMVDDEYRVSFRRSIPGYRLLRERRHAALMPPREDSAVRVFLRQPETPP